MDELQELKIEATPDELEDLRSYLRTEMGDQIQVKEVKSTVPGQLGEPVLISLVVALGGPVIVTGFVSALKAWLKNREAMGKQKLDRLDLMLRNGKKLSVKDLERLAKASSG